MYYNGEGVPENDEEALKWYTKAAEQGDADAQFNLGVIYDDAKGVPQNYIEAYKWFRSSERDRDLPK
ncbi:MAG: sel1 repeat family protein [Sedimentisphaerales bacterium]|nr:sel1 repeat family protein [Sedimentisphaerales bacterium]